MIKVLEFLEIDKTQRKIIKAIYNKLIADIILNRDKMKSIDSKMRNEAKMPTLPSVTDTVYKVLANAVKQEKDIKA